MSTGSFDAVTWHVRHRTKGDTLAEANVIPVEAPTPGEAVDRARTLVPERHAITSVAAYRAEPRPSVGSRGYGAFNG